MKTERNLLLFSGATLVGALLVGCSGSSPKRVDRFEEPSGLAVGLATDPELSGDAVPTAFVADLGHASIGRIDLWNQRFFTSLPIGVLPGKVVAAAASAGGEVDRLYIIDSGRGDLLEVAIEAALSPTVSDAVFSDVGDASSLALAGAVEVKAGKTPTQAWTVTYDSGFAAWRVSGDGLGEQLRRATTGEEYVSDLEEVRFTVTSSATPDHGDSFSFSTDNGIIRLDLGGARAVDLAATIDQQSLLIATTDPGGLIALDRATGTLTDVALVGGVEPVAIALSMDGSFALVADRGDSLVHSVDVSSGIPASFTSTSSPLAAAVRDVAIAPDGRRAFVLAAGSNDIYVLDIEAGSPPTFRVLDVLGYTAGVDAVPFEGGIRSMGVGPTAVAMRTGVPAYPLVLSTYAGDLRIVNGNSGCQDFSDYRGARLDGFSFKDTGAISRPVFNLDALQVSGCGGVARSQTWELVYNSAYAAWDIIGGVSGVQTERVVEGVAYRTDDGEVALAIDGDPESPTTEGDVFTFRIEAALTGIPVGPLPGEASFLTLTSDAGVVTPFAVVAASGSNEVAQVNLTSRKIHKTYRY